MVVDLQVLGCQISTQSLEVNESRVFLEPGRADQVTWCAIRGVHAMLEGVVKAHKFKSLFD